jgi:hypothetical protein
MSVKKRLIGIILFNLLLTCSYSVEARESASSAQLQNLRVLLAKGSSSEDLEKASEIVEEALESEKGDELAVEIAGIISSIEGGHPLKSFLEVLRLDTSKVSSMSDQKEIIFALFDILEMKDNITDREEKFTFEFLKLQKEKSRFSENDPFYSRGIKQYYQNRIEQVSEKEGAEKSFLKYGKIHDLFENAFV